MPLTVATWDNAVQREAAWFTTDTLASFSTAPALQKVNGGLFGSIQAYIPNIKSRGTGLYIYRAGATQKETRESMGGIKEWDHHFTALVQWPMGSSGTKTGALEDEQASLDTAIAAVLTRIRGPLTDKTHAITGTSAGFNMVGEEGDVEVDLIDPWNAVRKGDTIEVRIKYHAYDTFVA